MVGQFVKLSCMRALKEFHRRHLPHLQPRGGTFFVIYLLHGALPESVELRLQEEYTVKMLNCEFSADTEGRKHFKRFDEALHCEVTGNHLLRESLLTRIVVQNLHFWDNEILELLAFCVMSNHVHLVFRLFKENEKGSHCTYSK